MSKENGGPAFPGTVENYEYDGEAGMSLRDYFAAKAMLGQLTYGKCRDMSPAGISDYSYEYADAMLAERNKERTE